MTSGLVQSYLPVRDIPYSGISVSSLGYAVRGPIAYAT
jgi:hypothetical protein